MIRSFKELGHRSSKVSYQIYVQIESPHAEIVRKALAAWKS